LSSDPSSNTQRFLRPELFAAIFAICMIPLAMSLLGVDFGSRSEALTASSFSAGGVNIDDVFHAHRGAAHHTLLEWSAVVVAMLTVILSFGHFATNRDISIPVIGVALFCSGVMDGFHTLAALRLIDASAPNTDLIPFTWALSRTFNAVVLILGAIACLIILSRKTMPGVRWIIAISAVFGVSAYVLIMTAVSSPHLPQTQYPDALITRPFDVVPLILFIVAAPIFWLVYRKSANLLTASVLLALIPAGVLEAHMAFGSTALFDSHFNIAHALKVFEYAIPFMGLVIEHIRTQKEVSATKERLNLAVNGSADGLWDWDLGNGVAYYSPRFKELLGYEGDEFPDVIDSVQQALHPDDRNLVLGAMTRHFKERDSYDVQHRFRCRDGSYRWFRAKGQALWNTKGQPTRMAGSISDISELVRSRRRAEEASRLKSEFLANMSHEIRTPMNGVLGMAQALQSTPLNDNQRRMLDVINQAGESLMEVINDILDLSKIEADKVEIEEAVFDLEQLMKVAGSLYALKAEEKGLIFDIQLSDDVRACHVGDPMRIRQVLHNLISNAVKFTEAGSVSVTIERDEVADEVVFSVRDTGMGIAPDALANLFTPFTQADASTTRKHGGTGLGLAISERLCTLMGGWIRAQSVPGEGATFQFGLPLKVSDTAAPVEVASFSDDEPSAGTPERVTRILAAEDNKMNQEVLSALLGATGADLTLVSNGRQAVEAWRTGNFDVILMDVQMPVMDGVMATREIRALEAMDSLARTPIVALTANAMTHQVDEYLAAGMDDHVAKPVRVEKLFAAIERAFEMKDAGVAQSRAG